MNYQFNYGFLDEWLQANPDVKRADLLNALEIQSSNGINTWREKERPMPILTILKICNSFQIPLGMFFCDKDSEQTSHTCIPQYDINMQLEPDGGYCKERKPGKGAIIDPTANISHKSRIPEQYKDALDAPVAASSEPDRQLSGTVSASAPDASALGNIQSIDLTSLLELEKTHAEQRQELMDIIKSQRQQIVELTNKLLRTTDAPKHIRYGMVGENETGGE